MDHKITVNATQLDPSVREKVIFNTFDTLGKNETMFLQHDNNPAALKKLFEKERPGNYQWKVVDDNSGASNIAITKTKGNHFTLKELILKYPVALSVFEKYKFDYFRHSTELFEDICRNKQMDSDEILKEIVDLSRETAVNLRFDEWPPDLLMNFILNNHHKYLKRMMPELRSLMHHIEAKYLDQHPEISPIEQTFEEFSSDIFEHLHDEENIAFPLIRNYLGARSKKILTPHEVDLTMNWMQEDHLLLLSSVKKMRVLCNNYNPPVNSCPAFKVLYQELERFEKDLHYHLFLENSLLFPAVETALDRS